MARNHARILTSIWNDEDFLALSPGAQRMYFLLISQQNIGYAGLIQLSPKRWAKRAVGTDVAQVWDWLHELEAADFVIIDDDTDELLVRSFMRNDEVYKQPNVMVSASRDALAAASYKVRCALAVEARRLAVIDDLRPGSVSAIQAMVQGLPDGPVNPSPNPSGNPSTNPWGRGSVTTVTTDSPPPPPSPSTSPAPVAISDTDPTSRLILEHCSAYAEIPPPSAVVAVRREVMRLVAENVSEERIRAGLTRLRERRLAASLLPQLVSETSPTRRTSTTDRRVADALALRDRYAAEETA